MVRANQLSLLALSAFAVQDVWAKAIRNTENEFGRTAEMDAFKKFETVEEDKIFFRALQMSMSMSMSMSMGMEVKTEETPVRGASGESSGSESDSSTPVESSVVSETAQDTTSSEGSASIPLEPLDAAQDDSSAASVVVGIYGFVGLIGMMLL